MTQQLQLQQAPRPAASMPCSPTKSSATGAIAPRTSRASIAARICSTVARSRCSGPGFAQPATSSTQNATSPTCHLKMLLRITLRLFHP